MKNTISSLIVSASILCQAACAMNGPRNFFDLMDESSDVDGAPMVPRQTASPELHQAFATQPNSQTPSPVQAPTPLTVAASPVGPVSEESVVVELVRPKPCFTTPRPRRVH